CMVLIDQGVVRFVQNALQKGSSRAEIEQVLSQKGWKADQIQDAFAEASRPSPSLGMPRSSVKPSLMNMRTLLIILGALFLLAILGVAYVFLAPSEECSSDSDCARGESCDDGTCVVDEGCSSDDDCGRGEECDSGECVTAVEEEVEPVIEEEPECADDSDCYDGFGCSISGSCYDSCTSTSGCADDYECDSGVCVEEADASNATNALEDYEVLEIGVSDFNSLSYPLFNVNYTNVGDASSSTKPALGCFLSFENGTFLNSSLSYVNYLGVNESWIQACETIYTTHLVPEVETYTSVNINVNATINYYRNVSETSYSNSLVQVFNVSLFNTTLLSSTACTSSSNCTAGYDCSIVAYCFDSCTEYGSECASGYSCSSGSCVSDTASTLGTLGSSCTSDSDCGEYVCDSSTCVECTTTDLDACDTGYGCYTWAVETSGAYNTCFDWCAYDTFCAEGYECETDDPLTKDGICTETEDGDCAEGIDDDGDDLVDSPGACDSDDDSSADIACPSTITKAAVCKAYCVDELGYTFVAVGGSCDAESETACNDGVDNDGDGDYDYLGDCSDPHNSINCSEYNTAEECSDACGLEVGGIYTEADTGCTSVDDDSEDTECTDVLPSCADGVDNDGDGLIDIADTGDCDAWEDEEETGVVTAADTECSDDDSSYSDPYLVKGIVTVTSSDGTVSTYTDGCVGARITEYSCLENGSRDY
ncbi:MAG: hypothetical protein AAB570_03525, partial [Patescibacteria group bacterium]